MLFGDAEEHCKNVPVLIIDADSFQLIIISFMPLLSPIKPNLSCYKYWYQFIQNIVTNYYNC